MLSGLIAPSAILTAIKEITADNIDAAQPLIKPRFFCFNVADKPAENPEKMRQTVNIGK